MKGVKEQSRQETIYNGSQLTTKPFLMDVTPLRKKKLACRWITSSANPGTLMGMWDF